MIKLGIDSTSCLEIYIDNVGAGGAERLLLDSLPHFAESFSSIKLYTLRTDIFFNGHMPASIRFEKISLMKMFILLLRSKNRCYVNLAKSQFLACLVAMIKSLTGSRTNGIFCHEHTSPQYFQDGETTLKRLLFKIYQYMICYCLKKNLIFYIVSTKVRLSEVSEICKSKGHVMLLPNSLPRSQINSLRVSRRHVESFQHLRGGAIRFFTFSRLHKVKQIDWAIESVVNIAESLPQFLIVLSVCGQGPESARLKIESTKHSELKNLTINFLGFVKSFESIASVSDFYLFPSRAEGFPISLLEAALTGLPSIANNCPHGPKDLSEAFSNIYLVDPPERVRFINMVSQVTRLHLANEIAIGPSPSWISSEALARQLIKFLRNNSTVSA